MSDGPRALPVPCAALIVLDGWGLAPEGPGNAIALARTPVFDALWSSYPHARLQASGPAVGLPEGQMGNSEVGLKSLKLGSVSHAVIHNADRTVIVVPWPEVAASRVRGRREIQASE